MKVSRLSSLRTGRLYPQEAFLVLNSVRLCIDPRAKEQPDGWNQWNISMSPSGLEAATFRFVAQCPNQLNHRVVLLHRKTAYFRPPFFLDAAPPYWVSSTPLLETTGLSRKTGHQFPSDVMPYLGKTENATTLLQNINTRIFCGFISLNILCFWNASEVRITSVPCHSAPRQPIYPRFHPWIFK